MRARARQTVPEEVRRIHRELARPRRAPVRIMIATDAGRPVRTLVLPRLVPTAAALLATALLVAAVVLTMTSLHLRGAVDRLRGRVTAMAQQADDLARHPLPDDLEAGPGGAAEPATTVAAARRRGVGEGGRFVVESVNSGAQVEVVIDGNTGEPEGRSYRELRHLMRCMRTTAENPIDPRLVDLLRRMSKAAGQKILLVSGFRAPMFSAATFSYHARGMAADIRIPGMTPMMVRDLARSMGATGIGYYPVSQFVHVDVRDDHATWTDDGSSRHEEDGPDDDPRRASAR